MAHPIYHITHYLNLESIISTGGLWCDRDVADGKVAATGIAHQHIKDRRTKRRVDTGPGGVLADYVPFYFAPRSPMLSAILHGKVDGYTGGQGDVMHLSSTAEALEAAGWAFVFTDGHAEMEISDQFTQLDDLELIDWDVMSLTYWTDTLEDPDRKRRRQAEFLVHEFCPWDLITEIGVKDESVAETVQAILDSAGDITSVIVRPKWYY